MTKGCRGSTRCQLQQLQQQQQQLVDLPHLGGGNRQSIVRIQRSRLNFSGRRLVPESEKELVPAFSKEFADPIKNLPFPRNMLMMQFNIFGIFLCLHFQLPEYPWHLFAFSEETHNFFFRKCNSNSFLLSGILWLLLRPGIFNFDALLCVFLQGQCGNQNTVNTVK